MGWISKTGDGVCGPLRHGDAVHREIFEEWEFHIDLRGRGEHSPRNDAGTGAPKCRTAFRKHGIPQGLELGPTPAEGWPKPFWQDLKIWNSPIPEEGPGFHNRCGAYTGAGDRRQSDNVCDSVWSAACGLYRFPDPHQIVRMERFLSRRRALVPSYSGTRVLFMTRASRTLQSGAAV